MKITLLFLGLILVFGCTNYNLKNTKGYFEGEVFYTISYEPLDLNYNLDTNYLKENLGSQIKLIFKNGNQKKEIYAPDGSIVSVRYADLEANKTYAHGAEKEVVYWFDFTVRDTKSEFKQLNDTVIFSQRCKRIEMELKGEIKNKKYRSTSLYCYSQELNVNPEWFKDYAESDYNKIIKVGKGLSIYSKVSMLDKYYTITKMTSYKRRKVNPSEIKFVADSSYQYIQL